jgi:hypothetical protein
MSRRCAVGDSPSRREPGGMDNEDAGAPAAPLAKGTHERSRRGTSIIPASLLDLKTNMLRLGLGL